MSDKAASKEMPTPPGVPEVSRTDGSVKMNRLESEYPDNGGYQGWKSSEDPNEGGVMETRFGGPDEHTQKQAEEFNKKTGGRLL